MPHPKYMPNIDFYVGCKVINRKHGELIFVRRAVDFSLLCFNYRTFVKVVDAAAGDAAADFEVGGVRYRILILPDVSLTKPQAQRCLDADAMQPILDKVKDFEEQAATDTECDVRMQ